MSLCLIFLLLTFFSFINIVKEMVKTAGVDTSNIIITSSSARKSLVSTLNDKGFSMADITVYTGHRNPASLLNYCSISTDKGGAVTHALLGRNVVKPDSA